MFLSLIAALTGCATINQVDPKTGYGVTYTGSAHGAAVVLRASDERPYDLASEAMDKGMSPNLGLDADGDVRFQAGYGYSGYGLGGSVGGYAPANTGYIPGQGFVVGPTVSALPPLAVPVVTTGTSSSPVTGQAIVPCPKDRLPQTVPEQAACAAAGVRSLTQNRTK
ncbi:hypothetical protein HY630_00430 [Candidatus Uhrbacteria bacterium]|nr:hypothetical protein [Candidatus Uhrbacteria bacterium]